MAWKYQTSVDRITAHVATLDDIEVEKLVRDADLNTLLTETRCRQIFGAHTYVTVSNFSQLASDGLYSEDDYKRLIQGVHIYQREVSRIVEAADLFDGVRVHFQGPKLHALFYRPIDDGEELASRAVLLQLVMKDFVKNVFNPAFPHYDNFIISCGSALGDVIGTRNGHRGDRELLFVGAPANYAAKIIGSWGSMRIDANTYDSLPDQLQELCIEVRAGVYRVQAPAQQVLDDLLESFGIAWERDASAERIDDDKRQFPLKDIAYSEADTLIDPDSLSIYNNKRVYAASVFADVSGFTRYIDAAQTTEEQKAALRVMHAIRKEMATVVKNDFDGVRIQYQGDRVQALFHLPKNDEGRIATKAVQSAIGLQSSMEHAIKAVLPEANDLHLAIGVDVGTTLVSRLGTRGQRDRICLGESVEEAAACEERCNAQQIGVTSTVYNALPEDLREHFAKDEEKGCYVADGLTAEKIEQASQAGMYKAAAPVFVAATERGVQVRCEEAPGARPITPSRSWAE